MSPTALATPPHPLGPKRFNLLDGQEHPHNVKGTRIVVTVQCIRYDAAYQVRVEQGSYRVDDLCGSYPTEQEACAGARLICQMYAREAS